MSPEAISIRLQQDHPIPLDMELSCEAGEIVVVVGPSGSGKTTLLRSICGIYKPANGRIASNGTAWFDTEKKLNLPVQSRRVGMVFQHYALFPHKTACKNIMLALGHVDTKQRRERAEELLRLVHMEGLGERYPHQLSGGQQQRVALARALAREPDVLLLDEPFSAVDQQTRRKLVRELVQLRDRINIPVIHVTHNLNEARRIADRICIISRGKTLQVDTPHNIMTRPDSTEVAYQTGHTNIFSGKIIRHEAERQVTVFEWEGRELEALYRPELAAGAQVDWLIPAEDLILHRKDRPSRGEKENPLMGSITEFLRLGESSSVTVAISDGISLSMAVPTHVARRNKLGVGETVTFSLLAEGIHLMPSTPGSTAQEPV